MAKEGIKELKEILDFVKVVGVQSVVALRDGLQLADFKVLLSDEVWQAGKKAIDGFHKVPLEAVDLDFQEIGELIFKVLGLIEKVSEEAKKPS